MIAFTLPMKPATRRPQQVADGAAEIIHWLCYVQKLFTKRLEAKPLEACCVRLLSTIVDQELRNDLFKDFNKLIDAIRLCDQSWYVVTSGYPDQRFFIPPCGHDELRCWLIHDRSPCC